MLDHLDQVHGCPVAFYGAPCLFSTVFRASDYVDVRVGFFAYRADVCRCFEFNVVDRLYILTRSGRSAAALARRTASLPLIGGVCAAPPALPVLSLPLGVCGGAGRELGVQLPPFFQPLA